MAGRIALDLKQFKHVKSDDKSTTLKHAKDGHTLVLAHKALSDEAKEQLKALSEAPIKEDNKSKKDDKSVIKEDLITQEEKPQKMADGGDITKRLADGETPLEEPAQMQSVMPEQPTEIPAGSVPESVAPEAPLNTIEPAQPELEAQQTANPAATRFGELKKMFPNQPDEVILRTIKREQNEQATVQQEAEKVAQAKIQENAQKETDTLQRAASVAQEKQSIGIPLTPQDQAALDQANKQVLSTAQAAPMAAPQPAHPAQAPSQPSAPQSSDTLTEGYNMQMQAARDSAKAEIGLAKEQANILKDQMDAQNTAILEYKSQYEALNSERQNLMADIDNKHIDPEQYWKGDANGNGSHSRLLGALGMIIAGFNPTSRPNAAIEYLNKQIDMNIEAQKQDITSKNNLLAANLKQFGNLQDATSMTKLMMNDYAQKQLTLAAANAKTPQVQAATMDAIGKLKATYAPLAAKLAASRTLASLQKAAAVDPSMTDAYLSALEAVDPAKAKDFRSRQIPGIGFANSAEGAKGVREMGTTVRTVNDSVKRLKEIAKSTGKSMNPKAIAEADTIRNMLIGQLRVPITGPGAMSEGEREILMKAIPDVTAIMSLDSSNLKRLDTLVDKVNVQYKHMLNENGLNPNKAKGLDAGTMSPESKTKILQWAQDPRNATNPKAQQILKVLGK